MTSPAISPKTVVQPGSDPLQRQFTFEEYCVYEDGTDNRYELVDGYLKIMSSPVVWHALVCEFLVYVFNQWFQKTGTQFWARREVGIRTKQNSSRIVDVCVDGQAHWQTLNESREKTPFILERPPLLVVEVASTNEKEDYEAKYREYAALGILEYWIVSNKRKHLRICNLTESGKTYVHQDFVKDEQIVSNVLPQLELTVAQVLNPAIVSQLSEQDRSQQIAAIEQAQQQAAESERRAADSERRAAFFWRNEAREWKSFPNSGGISALKDHLNYYKKLSKVSILGMLI